MDENYKDPSKLLRMDKESTSNTQLLSQHNLNDLDMLSNKFSPETANWSDGDNN